MSEDYDSSSGSYDEGGGSYSETSRESWFQRIGKAIVGVPIGLLLIVISLGVLFWNEGRAVDTANALAEAGTSLVTISSDKVDGAYEGKLVHTTGKLATEDAPTDAMFNVQAKGMIRLMRDVQMYLWEETIKSETKKKLGGGTETIKTATYDQRWMEKDKYKDSNTFMKSEGHTNPMWPDQMLSTEFDAQKVTLGAFTLSANLLKLVRGAEPFPVKKEDQEKLPEEVKDDFRVQGSVFYKGNGNETEPKIGDMKVSYRVVKPHEVSIIAEQTQNTFRAYQPKSASKSIEMLVEGNKSGKEMISEAEAANTVLTWILRLVFFVLVAVGIFLVFNPLVMIADVLPILGNLSSFLLGLISVLMAFVLSFITIAIAWIYYRPLLGIALLVVAGLAFIGVLAMIFLARGKRKVPQREDFPRPKKKRLP